MQLSVEVKRQAGNTFYICRGQLLNGCASEYLFDLLTRPDEHDAIVDLGEITAVDEGGSLALALSCQVLVSSQRSLFLRHAPPYLVESLRTQHGVAVPEWPGARPTSPARTAESILAKQALGGR